MSLIPGNSWSSSSESETETDMADYTAQGVVNYSGLMGPGFWDPLATQDKTPPTAAALRRIKKELTNFMKEPVEGIHFVLDDEKANIVHALVVGPPETPYEGKGRKLQLIDNHLSSS